MSAKHNAAVRRLRADVETVATGCTDCCFEQIEETAADLDDDVARKRFLLTLGVELQMRIAQSLARVCPALDALDPLSRLTAVFATVMNFADDGEHVLPRGDAAQRAIGRAVRELMMVPDEH